jgi:hypothetical protein
MKFVPLTVGDLVEMVKHDEQNEIAYRRGVHQALSMIADVLQAKGETKAANIAAIACDIAGEYRADGEPHPALLDELRRRIHRVTVARQTQEDGGC